MSVQQRKEMYVKKEEQENERAREKKKKRKRYVKGRKEVSC